MSLPAAVAPEQRIPHLELRSRLPERRRCAVRRYAARTIARTGVLVTADVLAILAARWLLRAVMQIAAPATFATFDAAGPLAAPGRPGSTVFLVSVLAALALTGSYGRERTLNLAARVAGAVVLAGIAAAAVLAAAVGFQAALYQIALFAGVAGLALVVARTLAEYALREVWPRHRGAAPAVLVAARECFDTPAARAVTARGGDFIVVGRVELPAHRYPDAGELAHNLRTIVRNTGAEALILCDAIPEAHVRLVVDQALDCGCQLLYPARALPIEGARPRLVWHREQPFLELGAPVLRPSAVIAKRITDVLVAGVLLLLMAPLMLLIAAVIRLDSPGPALFSQYRAGMGGRRFRMLKFRTMRDGADGEKDRLAHLNHTGDVRLFKIPGDPRVTRVGRFLRRWSLDELPQLWNVLRGEMSLIGPRPFFESDIAAYEGHQFRRLDTKPGLTGLWQVSGRSDVVDFDDVVYLDRQYIEQWSIWLDLSILFRTIPAVFRRTGAY